ncbi:MAG: lysostaphin resistance A-like protein, partial [Elainella sp.]
YGLVWNRTNGRECLIGLGLGLTSLLLPFVLQGLVGWIGWQSPQAVQFGRVLLEGLGVGLGVGLAEELVFRGWILDELERDYGPSVALGASSLLFAVLHFLRPLPEVIRSFPQFPGLVLLGLILVWMKRSTRSQRRTSVSLITQPGRLGLPIGFHAGLVWGYYLIQVGKLTAPTGRVPAWVTGIDGNPLAGAMGLVLLCGLAVYWRRRARR